MVPDPDATISAACDAPVAQLDRVSGYEPEGREFESLRARQTQQRVTFTHDLHVHANVGKS